MTEEVSGSDALALKTSAEKSNGGYVLTGGKTFIGMGPIWDIAIVFEGLVQRPLSIDIS